MIIIDDIDQGTPEWFALKAGVPSAGSCKKIVTSTGAPSKSRQDYMDQLADEAIRGRVEEGYQSKDMAAGTAREAESLIVYELDHLVDVHRVGFVFDDKKMYGCSPDGIVSLDGSSDFKAMCGLEMKNPLGKTHVKYLRENELPTGVGYFQQIQMSLLVTGFDRWVFMSYVPGHKPFYLQVERDEAFIGKLKAELEAFCLELALLIRKLKGV